MFVKEFCIFRSRDQGVVCGVLLEMSGRAATISEARQIHYWEGANTLFEMANHGCGNARISEPSELPFMILDICGVYQCTPEATKNLRQSRWNEPYKPSKSTHRAAKPGD